MRELRTEVGPGCFIGREMLGGGGGGGGEAGTTGLTNHITFFIKKFS